MQASAEQKWRRLRRERLIEAARRVFATRGFEQASMDEIAAAAGAGKPTLYRYFASKEALFEAVFVEALDALERRLSEAEATGGEPRRTLRRMVDALIPMFREHVASLRALSDSAGTADRSRRRILRQRAGDIEARLAGVLARGRALGAFHHVDDRLTARLIYGMVWSGSGASAWSDAAVSQAIVDLIVGGHGGNVRRLPVSRRLAAVKTADAGGRLAARGGGS
jgi:AcrR family transcriptional regulator